MIKRLREELDSWDLKSIFLTIFVIAAFVFIFFYFVVDIRDRSREKDGEQFKGVTTGEILSVEKADRITQGKRSGTRIFVDSYKVKYRFTYQNRIFEHVDVIPATTRNKKLLNEILNRGVNNLCIVRFDVGNPDRSLLMESE